jgi:hypothetical protein
MRVSLARHATKFSSVHVSMFVTASMESRRSRVKWFRLLHHRSPGKGEVVLTGTTHDDVVEDTDTDVFQGLHDLVGGVDILFGRIALLSGVRSSSRLEGPH